MSLFSPVLSILSISPKVRVREGCLTARTSLVFQFLSLFSWCKQVEVDPVTQVVIIQKRFLWFFFIRKEFPFDRIRRINYSYGSAATSWDMTGTAHDAVDSFRVMLLLSKPEQKVEQFYFYGEGARETGLTGMLMGDSAVDFQGNQAATSREFVMLLKKFTGKTLT